MNAATTRIGDAVASDYAATTRPADPTRNGMAIEITRFDCFAAQPTVMAMICTGSFGGAVG